MSDDLLQVENLKTWFGSGDNAVRAVDGISFNIKKGETFVLLGESGSGKSVTALSIMRLLHPAARIVGGEVKLDGKDLLSLPEYKMRDVRGGQIGMIFQEPQSSLNPVLTAGQQIGETLKRHKGLSGKRQREASIRLLEAVGIPEPPRRIDDYPHQFSGGMKQRIMIAIALAGEPDLLIADEPTTALDVTIQAQIIDLLKGLQRELGMAILFITHDLALTSGIADQVAIMRNAAIPSRSRREQEEAAENYKAGFKPEGSLLSVHGLKVYYPIRKGFFKRTAGYVKAVDGVTIDISEGQTVAVVGESGSGKTTMGKGILQLVKPTEGDVIFKGEDIKNTADKGAQRWRSNIQIVFQDPYSSMNPRMMVSDIIMEGMIAQNIGRSREERLDRVDSLLEQVGLQTDYKYRYPHEFSGGQRQRICIARALAVEPQLIICDEPTSALDVSVQAQILYLLKKLQKELGLAYLFITHNISVVEYLAHYVLVMYQGRIVEQGNVNEVLFNPQHEYTKQLLSAVPRIRTGT